MGKTLSKVFRSGNSQAISLNKQALAQAGLEIGDKLEYTIENGKIVFEKKERESFEDRWHAFFENGGTYEDYEVLEDEPVGREIW